MTVTTIRAGQGFLELDPSDKKVVPFDWDRKGLRASAAISTSNFTIAVVRQQGVTALTKDNEDILTAAEATVALERAVSADSRVTSVRLLATTATEGDEYILSNKIVTNETPVQELEQSIRVLIQNR